MQLACTASASYGYCTDVGESAVATTAGEVHRFPAALTSFIGHAGAVREVAGLLEEHRLVTVTGPGGSGKTRLTGQVARQVAGRFADGAWLAELAPVSDPAQVAAVVAAALRVRERPGVPAADALAWVLARQQLLLVLDNCEHVIGGAARLCAGLLAACDDVRVLATSREPLRVAGETRYRLGPLGLPASSDLAEASRSEAVALFTDRARRADTGFALDEQTVPVVARLVARLDGMPLAIELAAARVEALGVAQLLDRIDDRFALLVAGDRVAAGRQQSLAATVRWSYQLLSEQERRVFRAVSVFPGPFTLEAADAVAGAGTGPVVLHLVDCSLLAPPHPGPDGRARYGMLETLRAYGAQLLAGAGEQDRAAVALAGHALEIAEQAAAGLQTATGEVAAARWLDAEAPMMHQVLAWAMQHDPLAALRLAVALAPWWQLRGRLAGQYALLREAAGHAAPGGDTWYVAQFWLSAAAFYAGDRVTALEHLIAVRDAIEDRGPSRALAGCLGGQSLVLAKLGRIAEATNDGRRALALAREVSDPAVEALVLNFLILIALDETDDPDGALQLAQQAQQITADIPGWIARASASMLTAALIEAGDLAAAERSCAAWLSPARDAGDRVSLARLLIRMATLDLRSGRITDAMSHLREAVQIAAPIGQAVLLACLDCCGYLCAATGRAAEAVTLWAAYEALARHEGFTNSRLEVRSRNEPLALARRALGAAHLGEIIQRAACLRVHAPADSCPLSGSASGWSRPWPVSSVDGRGMSDAAPPTR